MWQYQNKKNLGYHSSWNGTKWQKTFFALKLVILTTSPTSLILPISLIINSFWKSPFQWHWSCWLYRLFLALKSLNLATFPTLNDNHKRDPSRQTGLQHKHIFIIRNFNHSTREWARWVSEPAQYNFQAFSSIIHGASRAPLRPIAPRWWGLILFFYFDRALLYKTE